MIDEILNDHGLPVADTVDADGTVQGYVIADPGSARAALEPIVELFDLAVHEEADRLVFQNSATQTSAPVEITDLVYDGKNAVVETVRTPDHHLPVEGILAFRDPLVEYQTASVRSVRFGASGSRQQVISFPGVLESSEGQALLDDWMRRVWSQRESVSFAVTTPRADIVPGAVICLPGNSTCPSFLVTEVEDGLVRKVSARQIMRAAPVGWRPAKIEVKPAPLPIVGQPYVQFLDLPSGPVSGAPQDQFRVAVWQKPWRSQVLFVSPEETGFAQRGFVVRPASVGRLAEPLSPGFEGRIDRSGSIVVELFDAELTSVSRLQLLNGANAAAIKSASGIWEVVQFQEAEEIAPDIWRLSALLRGQLGTGDATAAGAPIGSSFVILDDAVQPAGLLATEIGLALNWRVGPSGADFSNERFATKLETGGLRARLPLSPVHLKAGKNANGDLALSWIRRGRIDADDWNASEIPLGEEREEYRIEIARADGATIRTAIAAEPKWLYPKSLIVSDLGGAVDIDVTIRQLSVAAGWGIPLTRRVHVH